MSRDFDRNDFGSRGGEADRGRYDCAGFPIRLKVFTKQKSKASKMGFREMDSESPNALLDGK